MDSKKQLSLMLGLNEQMENWMPPWSVWSDNDINAERWEPVKGKHPRPGSQEQTCIAFVDPLGHCAVPSSITSQVDSFEEIRAGLLIVPKESDASLPMVYNGPSAALRSITEAVTFLIKINSSSPVPNIEMVEPDFTPQSSPWKPWHHIYSSCKAGKGIPHKPVTNGLGKYFVRLFYMGNWRRIPVDCWLPLDTDGNWLLPTCGSYLWPQILTKALLKIGALTWTAEDELTGWNPLICLTAWCPLSISCENLAPINLWKLFLKLLSKSNDVLDNHPELLVEDLKMFDNGLPFGLYDVSKENFETGEIFKQLNPKSERLGPATVLADLDEVGKVLLLNVDLTMDPSIEYPRPQTPQWKRFRWKDWATARGLIYERSLPTIRSVKMYSPNVRPIPEDILNKIVEPTVKVKGKDKPRKVVQVFGVELFASFEAMCCCIKKMYIFLRPSSFVQSMFINNLSSVLSQGEEENILVTYRGSRKFSMHSSLNTLQALTRTRVSSRVFILFDSDCCKTLFLSLSYISDIILEKCEHWYQLGDKSMQDDVSPAVSFLAEPYDWKLQNSMEPIHLDLQPMILNMGVGITVLQLWFSHPQNQISLLLSSQTPFVVGSRETVLEKMSEGSVSLRQYATELSKTINTLCNKTPYTNPHHEALEAFHLSYLPPCLRTREDPFNDPLAILLKSKLPNAFVAAAIVFGKSDILKQVTFLVECDYLITDVLLESHYLTPEQRSQLKEEQITIGKTKEVKYTRSCSLDTKRRKSKIEVQKRPILLPQFFEDLHLGIFFLKRMLMNDSQSLKRYPFRNDFNSLVYFNEYKGTQRVDPFQKWIPLFHLTLNHCQCLEARTMCAVHMTTPAPLWELKIIDNRTGNIIPNVLREPLPFDFVKGNSYTILGYCWVGADMIREIPWTLRILGTGVESVPHSCEPDEEGNCHLLSPKVLAVQELVDYYLPNKYNIACKALILYKNTITLTVRFAVSCRGAKFVAKLSKGDKVTHEFRGVGDLVVPDVTLVHCGRPRVEELCTVELTIVGGWRMNHSQLDVIPAVQQRARRRRLVFQGTFDSTDLISASTSSLMAGNRRRSMIGLRYRSPPSGALFSLKFPSEVIQNAPVCTIAIAFEPFQANCIRLELDDRALDELRRSKLEREKESPGRHNKGVHLREEFINRLKPTMVERTISLDFDSSGSTIIEQTESESISTEETLGDNHQTKSFYTRMKEQELSVARIENYIDNVVIDSIQQVQDAFDMTLNTLTNEIF